MDAHPDMIIPHEFNLFQVWPKNKQLHEKTSLFNAIYRKSREEAKKGQQATSHNYVNSGWQGRFQKLQVIGDKSAHTTTLSYLKSQEKASAYFREIAETTGVPVQAVFVVRNPYDMIARETIEMKEVRSSHYSKEKKFNNTLMVKGQSARLFQEAKAVEEMIVNWNLDTLEIHMEDFMTHPKEVMQDVCDFVQVDCSAEYLQQCYDKTLGEVSHTRTRDLIYWSPDIQHWVDSSINKYSFFQGYTLDSDRYERPEDSDGAFGDKDGAYLHNDNHKKDNGR